MSSDDSTGSRPAAPIVLRLKLRYDDVEVMVQQFATNVGKSGLFLPTKSIQPIGAEIKFELRLADDTPALVGLGRVKSARPPDPQNPKAIFGMAIELMRVTPQSRALILQMLEHRRALGLPEIGLPTADDVDAARRAEATPPAREPASGPVAVPPGKREPPAPPAPRAGEALLTAPRRTSGPVAIAKVLAVAPLPPEPPRRKRMAVSEIIESASGPIAGVSVAVPGIDDDIDLAAALSRARRLAGDALDAELDALCEAAAAPREISIDAASAELARQLGGSAVRRDRSARWAPPPTTVAAPAAPASEPAAERHDAGAVPEPIAEPDSDTPVVSSRVDVQPTSAGAADAAAPLPRTTAQHEVQPEQIADEIQQLRDQDLEDVERTELGDIPVPPSPFDHHGFATEPSMADQRAPAAQLEAQLARAEIDADADDRERTRELGALAREPEEADPDRATFSGEPPMDVSVEEIDDFEILAEADADDEDLLAAHGEQDVSDAENPIALPPGDRPPSELDFAARLDLGEDSDVYPGGSVGEFSTRHVLDGLPDDFAASDPFDDELATSHLESARQALAVFDTGDEPLDDADQPLDDADQPGRISQPIFEPEPSNTFRLADVRPERSAASPDARSAPVIYREPSVLRGPSFPSLLDSPVEDYELEHALEALDVDLDDLAIPLAATELHRDGEPARSRPSVTIRPPQPRTPPSPSRAPAATPSRAVRPTGPIGPGAASGSSRGAEPRRTTEDGVLIDFDDDE